jgi:hypothetical protein
MTTVSQLIQWLYTQDPNKSVLVMREHCRDWSTWTEMEELVLPDEHDYSPNVDIFDNAIWFGER